MVTALFGNNQQHQETPPGRRAGFFNWLSCWLSCVISSGSYTVGTRCPGRSDETRVDQLAGWGLAMRAGASAVLSPFDGANAHSETNPMNETKLAITSNAILSSPRIDYLTCCTYRTGPRWRASMAKAHENRAAKFRRPVQNEQEEGPLTRPFLTRGLPPQTPGP